MTSCFLLFLSLGLKANNYVGKDRVVSPHLFQPVEVEEMESRQTQVGINERNDNQVACPFVFVKRVLKVAV